MSAEAPPLDNLLIVAAVAFAIPFILGLAPRLRVPAAVAELLAGIVLGPSVLGWVELDVAVQLMSTIGVAFLLFLAGMELDVARLRGTPLRLGALGSLLCFALALTIARAT